ncbi:MAG: 50S ribosomal protein L24 [uncultured bacterium]|jgi:large subunit ribosomal protein L24|nr:MAG: 50S ribosomal protein L24 [uncultured bacterium]KKP29587.1 MAG: 50S ribosomal protein L24 [candidate division TM6 bacterium GW2011_GWF2_30_66]
MSRIKKNDTVLVISGKDKGKRGSVIDVVCKEGRILVQGINVVIRHAKARKQGDVAGIKHEERPVDISNVMPICPSCKKPCRIGSTKLDSGKRGRICISCKENI